MTSALKQYWQQRAPRERGLLLFCCAALLLLLVQQAVLQPLQQWQQQQQQARQLAERDLRWMQQQLPQLTRLQQQQPQPLPAALSGWLPQSAQQMNVQLHIRDGVLTLPAQPAAPLLAWLLALEKRYGLQASQLMLQTDPAGQVRGEIAFRATAERDTPPAVAQRKENGS